MQSCLWNIAAMQDYFYVSIMQFNGCYQCNSRQVLSDRLINVRRTTAEHVHLWNTLVTVFFLSYTHTHSLSITKGEPMSPNPNLELTSNETSFYSQACQQTRRPGDPSNERKQRAEESPGQRGRIKRMGWGEETSLVAMPLSLSAERLLHAVLTTDLRMNLRQRFDP